MINIYKTPVIDLVGASNFLDLERSPEFPDWDPHGDSGAEDLIEMAGRGCYASWDRPRPDTAHMDGYMANILEVGHGSVLEHSMATFYIQGVSRTLTHELVRHRHFGFSQLSQRFVDSSNFGIVIPPLMVDDEDAIEDLVRSASRARSDYEAMVERAEMLVAERGEKAFAARKAAREAARAVLPNMTETKITVSGNFRAWRHFISVRGAEGADMEMRRLARDLTPFLRAVAPSVFQDLHTLPEGAELEYGSV